MNQVIHSLGGITVEAGGAVLAHAAGYEVKSSRAMTAVRPYGSTEPLAFLPGTATHILQLEQIKWEQPADFYTMSNYTKRADGTVHRLRMDRCGGGDPPAADLAAGNADGPHPDRDGNGSRGRCRVRARRRRAAAGRHRRQAGGRRRRPAPPGTAGERKPRKGGATMKQETRTVAAAVRAPEGKPSLRREKAPEIAESGTVTEVVLQDAATLETELSALQRRKLRLAPEMDRCGEPLY